MFLLGILPFSFCNLGENRGTVYVIWMIYVDTYISQITCNSIICLTSIQADNIENFKAVHYSL